MSGPGRIATPYAMRGDGAAVPSPLHVMPQDAMSVDTTQRLALGGDDSGAAITYEVPPTKVLRIAAIGMDALDKTAIAFASWGLFRNGEPIAAYGDMPCAIGSLANPAPVVLFIHGPARLEVMVRNNLGLQGFVYFVRMMGWLTEKVVAS